MPRRAHAFTLIELIVVLAVIAVLSTVIVPSFSANRAKAQLRESAKQLWTTMRFAQQHATLHHTPCRLVLIEHPGGNNNAGPGFRVEVASSDPDNADGYTTLRAGPIRSATFPAGVTFGRILIAGESATAAGTRVIRFTATGQTDAATIQVTDGQQTWSIAIDPNNGRCQLFDTALSTLPHTREDLDA